MSQVFNRDCVCFPHQSLACSWLSDNSELLILTALRSTEQGKCATAAATATATGWWRWPGAFRYEDCNFHTPFALAMLYSLQCYG